MSFAAHAGSPDPFQQLNVNNWMSFQRYKAELKSPPNPVAQDQAADASAGGNAAAAKTPPAPALSRPITPPVMPGLNQKYDIRVNSTVDDDLARQQAITNPANNNWKKAAEVAREKALHPDADTNATPPLDVRMTYLPNREIEPASEPHHKNNRERRREYALTHPKAAKTPKTAEDLAACAAISTYKKRQLEALQSDRQTLAALQAAIADLGLQKQLSFMTDINGSLNASDRPTKIDAPAPVDLPAALSNAN